MLCLHDLVLLTGGELCLASMPSVDGEWGAVGRIAIEADRVEPGDVYWDLVGRGGGVQLALFRGAQGVVSSRRVEPWPGRFALRVADAAAALEAALPAIAAAEESFSQPPELKVLQLCGNGRLANFPLTCGQSAKGLLSHRCRQRAA